jgi:hypothetical protein
MKLAELNPLVSVALRAQMTSASVSSFENTGAGFFSDLVIEGTVPEITGPSPIGGVRGDLSDVPHGMEFLLFHERGRGTLLEGYCLAGEPTGELDFEAVEYALSEGLPLPRST